MDDKKLIKDKELEDVNGGYSSVTTYTFEVADKFIDNDGSYFYVANRTVTADTSDFIYSIVYDATSGKTYYTNCQAGVFLDLQFAGNDKTGFEAAKKIAKY